jgi:hypothetical protein
MLIYYVHDGDNTGVMNLCYSHPECNIMHALNSIWDRSMLRNYLRFLEVDHS